MLTPISKHVPSAKRQRVDNPVPRVDAVKPDLLDIEEMIKRAVEKKYRVQNRVQNAKIEAQNAKIEAVQVALVDVKCRLDEIKCLLDLFVPKLHAI